MNNKHFFSLFLSILFVISSQSCSVNQRIKKADKHYELGEYVAAGDIYRKVYSKVPNKDKLLKSTVAFKQGECYRMINRPLAQQAYANAIRNNYPDSSAILLYAQVLHRNGKYADAAKNYSLYMEYDPQNEVAKNGLYAMQHIGEWKETGTRYKVKKSTEFNIRRAADFSPAFPGDDTGVLYFTSTRQTNKKAITKNSKITGLPNNNIFFVKKNAKGKWENPEKIEDEINTTNDEGACSFTSDGRQMFFTRAVYSDSVGSGTHIMVSNRTGGAWSAPQIVQLFSDSTISVGHPAISPDGQTLYFVSDSPDGRGGKDIWRARNQDGEWKYIENLGAKINTSSDEMFPAVKSDGTLYFSSSGLPGFGGLDIFKAIESENGDWTVENMGHPINSEADDFGITFEKNKEKGYFSSTRKEVRGFDNIWEFELPDLVYMLQGKVFDEQGEPVPDAQIRLVSDHGVNTKVQARKDGSYRIDLLIDGDYVMLASARGYLNRSGKLETHHLTDSKIFTIDFQLSPVGRPVQMDNIFYDFGKWTLRADSEAGLQELIKLLNDNPNITIEIGAHTDYVGNNAFNKDLSEKRAQSVVDYLIAAGIAKDRLTAVGYGEEQPFTVDVRTAREHKFLKENDLLTEEFVLKLTPEEQEIVNQINRRTEFRVLRTTYNLY
ncbi:MAG: OmpA family protein [Prevotellaceae bacterium]|jgi:peptidoglycan-associated lipoprotein|nr:OmpA family protein [Prevotellaceae bacterium]